MTLPLTAKIGRPQLFLHTKEELIDLIDRYQEYITDMNQMVKNSNELSKAVKAQDYRKPMKSSELQPRIGSLGQLSSLGSLRSHDELLGSVNDKGEESVVRLTKIVDILLTAAIKEQRNDLIAEVQKNLNQPDRYKSAK